MNDKQNPQGNGNKSDSDGRSEVRNATNEDSLVDLAHSVKNGSKSQSEQTLQQSSVQSSEGIRGASDSSEIPATGSQGDSSRIGNDQMDEITKKLEDDLLSELHTALERPLEINSKGDSSPNQNDSKLPNENSSSDVQIQKRQVAGPTVESGNSSHHSNDGVQKNGSILTPRGENRNLNTEYSMPDQEIGGNAKDLPGSQKNSPMSAGQTESNQAEAGNQNSDSNQRISLKESDLEDSDNQSMIHDSSQDMTGLNRNSDVQSGLEAYSEIRSTKTDSQMSLPGMVENRNSISSRAYEEEESETTQDQASLGTISQLSRSENSSKLNQSGSNRGLTVALLGLALILLLGGAFFAVRSLTTESGNGEPPIIFADNSPMKILPQDNESDEVPSDNGKIIFDSVGDVFQENENVERLVEPEESEAAEEIAKQIANEVPIPTESNVQSRQVRTVVLQPDGTVIEGENQTGTSNGSLDRSADVTGNQNQTNQNSAVNEADGNEVSTGEDSIESEDSRDEAGDVLSEVEKLLSEDASAGAVESALDSETASEAEPETDSEAESGNQPLSDNQENAIESETETTSPIADIIENSDNAPLQDPVENTSDSDVEQELQPDPQPESQSESQLSYVLPRKKPTNLGERGFTVTGAIANVPLEIKELTEGTPVVQLSADKTIESARESYSNIRNSHPEIFENLSPIIQVGETDSGTWYRVQIEMDGYLNAIDFCSYLKSEGIECVAKRVDG